MATTTRYSLTKPTVGADAGAWGGYLNANLDTIDATLWNLDNAAVKTDQLTLDGATSGSIVVVAAAVASGTLTLPAATDTLVGRATIDTLTNKTLDTAGAGNVLRINGTQVSTVTGTGSVVLATGPVLTSPSLVTANIGTPALGTLTNCTGLPVSTGISGLGSGVATFLATPSSANLAAAVTDETGTGALVFGTSPTIATPTITTSATVPLVIGGTGTTSTLTLRSTSGVGTTGADIIFQAGNNGATEVMRLQNGGNVGIGTTNPQSGKLNVYGKALIGAYDSAAVISGGQLELRSAGATESRLDIWQSGVALGSLGSPASSSVFYIVNNYSATGLVPGNGIAIATDGKVGIGTSSPGYKLHVLGADGFGAGTAAAAIATSTTGNSATTLELLTGSGSAFDISLFAAGASPANAVYFNNRNSAPMVFLTGNSERMRILSTGEVGIGESSPAALLHVASGTTTSLNLARIYAGSLASGSAVDMYIGKAASPSQSGTFGFHYNSTSTSSYAYMSIYGDSSTTGITVTPGGKVGIGKQQSTYSLEISADSAAKPTTNTWTIASDSRLKTVKGEYQKGLAEICQVRPVSYEYNGKAGFIADGKDKVSILAQELMQVFPECVDTFKGKLEEDGPEIDLYNYNGHAITFALINAIKELKAKIDILEARN